MTNGKKDRITKNAACAAKAEIESSLNFVEKARIIRKQDSIMAALLGFYQCFFIIAFSDSKLKAKKYMEIPYCSSASAVWNNKTNLTFDAQFNEFAEKAYANPRKEVDFLVKKYYTMHCGDAIQKVKVTKRQRSVRGYEAGIDSADFN
ncbi:MAG: hypothetical protein ACI4FZ_05150 [Lachnospiraceae bacterium]